MKRKFWNTEGAFSLSANDRFLQNRLKNFCSASETFNAIALYEASLYFDKNQPSVYWDYNSSLSNDEIQKIWDGGYEGLNEVENELIDLNREHEYDLRRTHLKEEFLDELELACFRTDFILQMQNEYGDGLDKDDDLVEFLLEELEDELEEEAKELLEDHIWVDYDFEQLYRNTSSQQVEVIFSLSDYLKPEALRFEEWYEDEVYAYSREFDIEELIELAEKIKNSKGFVEIEMESYAYDWGKHVRLGGAVYIPVTNADMSISNYSHSALEELQSFEFVDTYEIDPKGKFFVSADKDAYIGGADEPLQVLVKELEKSESLLTPAGEMSHEATHVPFVMKDASNKWFAIAEYDKDENVAFCYVVDEWVYIALDGNGLLGVLDDFSNTSLRIDPGGYIAPDGTMTPAGDLLPLAA